MEENINYVTNVVLPTGETVYIKDEDALHTAEYNAIKANVDTIQAKVDELITKLSNMAYDISAITDPNPNDNIPDGVPTKINSLTWE